MPPRARARSRTERGAAAVEFALVLIPLIYIVFGIIDYGFMLSFRQQVSQAADEGARAGAVQIDSTKQISDATSAVNSAMNALKVNGSAVTCGSGGLTCAVSRAACTNDSTHDCITVKLTYAYKANPVIPSMPLVPIPTNLEYTAIARVN
jgi:Flp pilus assembly protein TadG